eukprot:COSAG05_NODE_3494_length_2027_cov_1.570539_2_plen_108_part_00
MIAHLETLGAEEVVRESVEFYKWIVMFPTSECNIHYAETLLDYFHTHNLLTCKHRVMAEAVAEDEAVAPVSQRLLARMKAAADVPWWKYLPRDDDDDAGGRGWRLRG